MEVRPGRFRQRLGIPNTDWTRPQRRQSSKAKIPKRTPQGASPSLLLLRSSATSSGPEGLHDQGVLGNTGGKSAVHNALGIQATMPSTAKLLLSRNLATSPESCIAAHVVLEFNRLCGRRGCRPTLFPTSAVRSWNCPKELSTCRN